MNLILSDIRIGLLAKEYGISFRDFSQPTLYGGSAIKEFKESLIGRPSDDKTKKNYRLLSIAILSEYISTRLNSSLSQQIKSISEPLEYYKSITYLDPLLNLLIMYNLRGQEINSGQYKNAGYFEEFLILDRKLRSEESINGLLKQLRSKKRWKYVNEFKKFESLLDDSFYDVSFWKGIKNNDFFNSVIGFIHLNNFLVEFSNLIEKIESGLLKSAFWYYYERFFSKLLQSSKWIEENYRLLLKINEYSIVGVTNIDIQSSGDFTETEAMEWKKTIAKEIEVCKEIFYKITDPKLSEELIIFNKPYFVGEPKYITKMRRYYDNLREREIKNIPRKDKNNGESV